MANAWRAGTTAVILGTATAAGVVGIEMAAYAAALNQFGARHASSLGVALATSVALVFLLSAALCGLGAAALFARSRASQAHVLWAAAPFVGLVVVLAAAWISFNNDCKIGVATPIPLSTSC